MADYEDTNVKDLIINNMSQEKFDELKTAGELDPTQIYLTPTEEGGGASPDEEEFKAVKIPFVYEWEPVWSYKLTVPDSVTNSPVGSVFSFVIRVFDPNNDYVQFLVTAKHNANWEGDSSLTFEVIPKPEGVKQAAFATNCSLYNFVSGSNYVMGEYNGVGNYWEVGLSTIFGFFDGITDSVTYETYFSGAVTKIKNEITGEVLDYPEVTLEKKPDNYVAPDFPSSVSSPYTTTANSISFPKYNSYIRTQATPSTASSFVNISLEQLMATYGTCYPKSASAYIDYTSPGPWKFRISFISQDQMSTMTFEYSFGFGCAHVKIIEQSGMFEKLGDFYVDRDGLLLRAKTIDGSTPLQQTIWCRGIAMGSTTFETGTLSLNFYDTYDFQPVTSVEKVGESNIVKVLPDETNNYTTVKNYGNGYVEITGYASIGTVGAGTGSEVQIDLPAGYTMADTNYWVNIAPTSETTMFDFKAEAKARSTTHFMVAYKNEDTVTGLTAAGVYWEVRGILATTGA